MLDDFPLSINFGGKNMNIRESEVPENESDIFTYSLAYIILKNQYQALEILIGSRF